MNTPLVEFVGAGPGAEDLITLRGLRALEQADLVVYAGSLVNPGHLKRCKPDCECRDSAAMNLREQVAAMSEAALAGKRVVRLHTGDPAMYGAINEQIRALAEKGIAFEQQANGELGFTQEINQEKLAAYKEYEDGKLEYFAQCKDIEAGIEEAYNAVSLERLQKVLTEEAAMRLSNMEAEKSLMDTYQQAYLESHATMMELAANLSATALDGLSTAFTDILTGAQSAKNAFESLGKSMIKVIAQYFAQMAAGMIITALLGKQQNTKAAAETQAMATAAAGALAPAAWLKLVLTPSAGPVATGLLTAGVASSVGIGLAASSIGGAMGNGGGVNQYAEGGYFTKPLFGILGDAGDEVALPLNKAVFENIAQGITDASEDNSSQNVSATFNNYGDINNAADLDDLMDGFNDAVLAGLRGAR